MGYQKRPRGDLGGQPKDPPPGGAWEKGGGGGAVQGRRCNMSWAAKGGQGSAAYLQARRPAVIQVLSMQRGKVGGSQSSAEKGMRLDRPRTGVVGGA